MEAVLPMLLPFGAVLAAVFLLWKGADWVVDGAAAIARRIKVSELLIGLTLVAAGTSAPEFAVSIRAALAGQTSISVGNIVGSNIFNLGLILGACALIRPILTSRNLVRRDVFFLLTITVLLAVFLRDLELSRWEGAVMVSLMLAYIVVLWWIREPPDETGEEPEEASLDEGGSLLRDILFLIAGLVMVIVGSRFLIYGATGIALAFGLSEWTIGVTVVAAGTSAPEVVTSLTAVIKGRHGLSAGGLVGSDIYNLLGVLGVAAVITPLGIERTALPSLFLLTAMVGLVLVFMRTGWRVSRVEGFVLLGIGAVRMLFDISGGSGA